MMKINSEVLVAIEKYATTLLTKKLPKGLTYHTIEHTRNVVHSAELIGWYEHLPNDDLNILLASAWLHDVGYINKIIGHEIESVVIAEKFLKSSHVDDSTIALVVDCIKATTPSNKPTNHLAEILCDADLMHWGANNYFELAELMRQELNNTGDKKIKKSKFREESIQLFKAHTYSTEYCRGEISEIKAKNLLVMENANKKRKKKKKLKSKNTRKYPRGVDSMFKLTARNQISLSSIADNKSNILISLNGIIISMGIVSLASRFREEPTLILPTAIFVVFSLSSIVLAILATRPNISFKKPTKEDVERKNINLLFFENFYRMSIDEYSLAIRELIDDDQYLYSTLTLDQYYLGKVLARKYKLLKWAYNVFMVGIVVSAVFFMVVFIME